MKHAFFYSLLLTTVFTGTAFAGDYVLSTGAKVDASNLASPRQSGNGAAAEKWCNEAGKRLPTFEELQEMYLNKEAIGNFTNGFDAGGWPYWSQKTTNAPDGKDYAYRIIFGNGAEEYQPLGNEKYVKKFGSPGESQQVPFWIKSGFGAYVRCVSD